MPKKELNKCELCGKVEDNEILTEILPYIDGYINERVCPLCYSDLCEYIKTLKKQIAKETAKEIFKDLESKFTNKITDTIMWKNLKKKWLE